MAKVRFDATEAKLSRAWSYYLTSTTDNPVASRAVTDYLNAVKEEARREERKRLWRAIDPLVHGSTEEQITARLTSVGSPVTIEHAYSLGVSTALMETAKEVPGE